MSCERQDMNHEIATKTHRITCSFKATEYAPDVEPGAQPDTLKIAATPFLDVDYSPAPGEEPVPVFLAFDFLPSVTLEQAEEVARVLNRYVRTAVISYYTAEEND